LFHRRIHYQILSVLGVPGSMALVVRKLKDVDSAGFVLEDNPLLPIWAADVFLGFLGNYCVP
jgi:hypothetical protein